MVAKEEHKSRHLTPKKFFLIVYDLAASMVSVLLALLIVYDGSIPQRHLDVFKSNWYIVVALSLVVFYLAGFYDQMWAFARGSIYMILPAGTAVQLFLMVLILQILKRNFAFSVYIIYWFLLSMAVFAIRFIYRLEQSRHLRIGSVFRRSSKNKVRVMIVGAGSAGSQLIVELKTSKSDRVPICAVDDNPLTHSYKNNGVPVLGDRYDIERLVEDYRIDEIIVAIPSAPIREVRDILKICNRTNCRVRILPFFSEIHSDQQVHLSDVRELRLEDLLGRDPVETDLENVSRFIQGNAVLVTGGGGSIGSELARQIAKYQPSLLILFDIFENGVYNLQQELINQYGRRLNLQVLIGSVRDADRLDEVFKAWKPDIVFHAAAHKHVPLMEHSPGEAVKNNVFGTYNTSSIAARYGVKKFVLISTDKAVNPKNVMGATKRLCEIVTLELDKIFPETSFSSVRFGNVLGSSGSVIPLFEKQIKERQPVTVTHPKVERYFMTIPEAASLVLQAGADALGGEIFILDMGEPVLIDTLARDMIRLSGLVPDVDIPIRYIGLREGEKMREELLLNREMLENTKHEKIFKLKQIDDLSFLKQEVTELQTIIDTDDARVQKFFQLLFDAQEGGGTSALLNINRQLAAPAHLDHANDHERA
jgi:FlaA1/EpsC-like NDP-sugar epimerase